MEINIQFTGIDITEKVDFNWARFSLSIPAPDRGSILLADIQIRVPKKLNDLKEINQYAFDQIKDLLAPSLTIHRDDIEHEQ